MSRRVCAARKNHQGQMERADEDEQMHNDMCIRVESTMEEENSNTKDNTGLRTN